MAENKENATDNINSVNANYINDNNINEKEPDKKEDADTKNKKNVEIYSLMHARLRGYTAFYLRLPLYFSFLFIPLIVWMGLNDEKPAVVISGAFLLYIIISISLYFFGKRQYVKELVDFATDYSQVQKKLIKGIELPYGLLDKDGRILWCNTLLEDMRENTGLKYIDELFPDVKTDVLDFADGGKRTSICITHKDIFYRMEFVKVPMDDDFTGNRDVGIRKSDEKNGSGQGDDNQDSDSRRRSENQNIGNNQKNDNQNAGNKQKSNNEDTDSKQKNDNQDTNNNQKAGKQDSDDRQDNDNQNDDSEQYLIAMYMFDETELKRLSKENVDQRMVAGLLYIDNYDDALESIEDVRRALLVGLIDRKINKYFATYNAVVRKLEKDKYFIAIKQKYVSALQSNKFSILDEVKTVNIGNEMAVTISIGLGVNGDEYTQNCEYSRVAIDLALGRGGDQAVVKDGEKIYFYGGKSKQVEKNTRVKARVKAHALRELLETKEQVIIMGHKIGDIDSLGSAIGIFRAVKSINKQAYIVINEITSSIRPMLEILKQDEEYEDIFINSEEAQEIVDINTAIVVVDVSRPSYVECPQILSKSKAVVVLDHHRRSSDIIENASLSYIEPYASSASEMVAEILQYFYDGIKIRVSEAEAMYAGIMIDTNNFTKNTGVRTFEAAAFLRKCGADLVRVKQMFRDSMDDYKARAKAISSAEVFGDRFAISVCPSEGLDSPTVVGAQAANELLNIRGIKASFVLTEHNNKIYISARSMGDLSVQLIMEKLGGGGHLDTAGAQLENVSIAEAKQIVKDTVLTMIEEKEV